MLKKIFFLYFLGFVCFCCLVSGVFCLEAKAEDPPQFEWAFDFYNNTKPEGVAVDSNGNVYVAATGYDTISKYSTDKIYLKGWGSSGSADGQLSSPSGIAVDSNGNLYIADTGNHRFQKFSPNVTFLDKWGGVTVTGANGLYTSPKDIAVDSYDNFYFADTGNDCIRKYRADGVFQDGAGGSGAQDGQFSSPSGIAVDSNGNVYVADTYNHRIQKFASYPIMRFLSKWGSQGAGDGEFSYPYGIAVDNSGNVYVADTHNDRIQKFSADGRFLAKWGSYGQGDGQFSYPRAIAVDSVGNVYVADTYNDRIQKFAYGPSGGFTVTAPINNTTEQGGQATFTVVLDIEPSANVTIALSSSNIQEGTVFPENLTFTPFNWDTPQTVTITGVDDNINDGNIDYTITIEASSTDTAYNSLSPYSFSITNIDDDLDDSAGITLNPTTGLTTSEETAQDTFSVVLETEPSANVTIALSSSNTQEGTKEQDNILIKVAKEAIDIVKESVGTILEKIGLKRDTKTEETTQQNYVAPLISGSEQGVSTLIQDRIKIFITYGTLTTRSLGSGERAGVIYSYQKAYKKLPDIGEDWEDVIKIANGRFPKEQSIENEKQALKEFTTIYKKLPNFKNQNDEAALKVIAYGIRPKDRNLNSEKSAIQIFKAIYDKTPQTTQDWDIVRAIAYSGATR